MTIAIGFAYKDGFIMASDSQMTQSAGTFKRWDQPKIFPVAFKNLTHVCVCISGSIAGATDFRDRLEEIALETEVTKASDVQNAVESAMLKTKQRFLEYIQDDGGTTEAHSKHLELLAFDALVAFIFSGHTHVFAASSWHGRAQVSNKPFEAIGCGESVASVILSECDLGKLNFDEAFCVAVRAIEYAKRFDAACGGPIQHLFLSESQASGPFAYPTWMVKFYEQAVEKIRDRIAKTTNEAISEEADKIAMLASKEGELSRAQIMQPFVAVSNPSSESRLSSPKPDSSIPLPSRE